MLAVLSVFAMVLAVLAVLAMVLAVLSVLAVMLAFNLFYHWGYGSGVNVNLLEFLCNWGKGSSVHGLRPCGLMHRHRAGKHQNCNRQVRERKVGLHSFAPLCVGSAPAPICRLDETRSDLVQLTWQPGSCVMNRQKFNSLGQRRGPCPVPPRQASCAAPPSASVRGYSHLSFDRSILEAPCLPSSYRRRPMVIKYSRFMWSPAATA